MEQVMFQAEMTAWNMACSVQDMSLQLVLREDGM